MTWLNPDRHNLSILLNHSECDPAFTVHVYAPRHLIKEDPTCEALRDQRQKFYILYVEEDAVAHHYVTDELDCYSWPVVTITSGADLITHWEGYRADLIALVPAPRA